MHQQVLDPVANSLGTATGLAADTLGAMIGRQTPILALFVPLALVMVVDGWRGIRRGTCVRALRDHHRGLCDLPDSCGKEPARLGDDGLYLARPQRDRRRRRSVDADEVHAQPAHHSRHPDARRRLPHDGRAAAVRAAGPEGLRGNAASTPLGDRHRYDGARTGVRDDLSGQTITLRTWMAAAGGVFALPPRSVSTARKATSSAASSCGALLVP